MGPPARKEREKQLGLLLPVPLSVRLDRLLQRAAEGGERTSRKGLVAGLIEGAQRDTSDLNRLVRALRTAPLRAAVLAGDEVADYLDDERRPGPRGSRWVDQPALDEQVSFSRSSPDPAPAPDSPLLRAPSRRVGLAVPLALDKRLDALVRAVESDGGSTSRSELLAALVLAAPEDPDELVQLVAAHRRAQRRRERSPKRRR